MKQDQNSEATQTVSYTVAARLLPRIQGMVEKINKRCRRLRIPELVLKITGSEVRKMKKHRVYVDKGVAVNDSYAPEYEVLFNTVEMTGGVAKLAGWEFAATLEHDIETGLTVLRTSSAFGKELPPRFRTSAPICEHCNKTRKRKDTYVVYNAETDTFKQVGHQCVADFLGMADPNRALSIAEMWQDIETIMCGDFEEGEDNWREWSNEINRGPVMDLNMYLERVAAVVRVFGFVSRKAVREGSTELMATADRVMDHLFPTKDQLKSERFRAEVESTEPTDADKAKAAAALAWIKSQDPEKLNDYMFNLYAATANEIMPYRRTGIVASLISAYNKHIEFEDARVRKAKEWAEKTAGCKHLGTVGERLRNLNLKVVRVIPREGDYGVTYITALEDANNNQFTWFASGTCLDVGRSYNVTGTVKAHSEFRGVPQTVLSRCKAVELEEVAS